MAWQFPEYIKDLVVADRHDILLQMRFDGRTTGFSERRQGNVPVETRVIEASLQSIVTWFVLIRKSASKRIVYVMSLPTINFSVFRIAAKRSSVVVKSIVNRIGS